MRLLRSLAVATAIASRVTASPMLDASSQRARAIDAGSTALSERATIASAVTGTLGGIAQDITQGAQVYSAISKAIIDSIAAQTPPPKDVPIALAELAGVFGNSSAGFYDQVTTLIRRGFGPTLATELSTLLTASFAGQNSRSNVNLAQPKAVIYPQKDCADAPYSLSEAALRQVIYVPPSFTYGAKPPVILVPGTGNTGYQSFAGNYIPLLQGASFADPVWLNIPDQLLADAQVNAEYVAYAINYISGITSKNVSVISWSQGSIDTQWALKYWPSTRQVVSNFVPHSPDFHGTVLAYLLCPDFPRVPCPPSIIQQEYNSNLIRALRSNGGDSAYVPTTSVFSATDEVVQPQSPVEGASSFIADARGAGVSNSQVQAVCGGRGPAGTFYTHEGVLYNPLAYALTVDALTQGGPGQTSRLDLSTVCGQSLSPGLDLVSLLATEQSILVAAASVALYPNRQFTEPPLKEYALRTPRALGSCS